MKRTLFLNVLIALALVAVGGTGCRKKPVRVTQVPSVTGKPSSGNEKVNPAIPGGGTVPQPESPISQPAPNEPTTPAGGFPLPPGPPGDMREDATIFKAYSVYFDFDRSAIKSNERSKLEAVADHLKGQPTHKLKIEGNCDERGTEGYNLALGERRALAAREYLIKLGIAADRIYTISYGESRPADPGHDDAAWAKNRRDDFVLLTP